MQDDRCNYRALDDHVLIEDARREGVTAEMGVVLAERLAAKLSLRGGSHATGGAGYGSFNTRTN